MLGAKASKADVALYEYLAPTVSKWTPEQQTGEHGHPHIIRHLDFVQNSPIFGLKVGEAEKIKVDADEILYVKPPVDAKAEKERLKKEKAAASAGGVDVADRTKEPGKKGLGEKVADKVKDAKDTVVAAVGGGDKPKKEKKEKAPKPQKFIKSGSALGL